MRTGKLVLISFLVCLFMIVGFQTAGVASAYQEIGVGDDPLDIAFSPEGDFAYVTNLYSNNVYVIRTSDRSIEDIISVGIAPEGIAVHPTNDTLYVANQQSNSISIINTNNYSIIGNVPVANRPRGLWK